MSEKIKYDKLILAKDTTLEDIWLSEQPIMSIRLWNSIKLVFCESQDWRKITVQDLSRINKKAMMQIPNCGKLTIEELESILKIFGLKMRNHKVRLIPEYYI